MVKQIFAFIILSLIPLYSFAADVAVVDIQKVMEKSVANKDIKAQIKVKRDAYQASILKEEEKLKKQEEELVKQRAILAPEAFEKKKNEFRNNLIKIQRENQVKSTKLNESFSDAYNKLQKQLLDVIAKISEEKKYSMVLPVSQILYYKGNDNITEEVAARLNKAVTKVKVEVVK